MSQNLDVLNLAVLSYPSRDTEKAALVCNYLRSQGASVIEGCVSNGYFLLLKYRPKILFISGNITCSTYAQVASFAKWLGSKVVTLTSEGGSKPGWGAQQFLDNIYEKPYFIDYWFQWNNQDKEERIAAIPEEADSFITTGSIGHDRYKLKSIAQKIKSDKVYKKIIGVGGWRFDLFIDLSLQGETYASLFKNREDIEAFFKKERDIFSNILFNIVKKYSNYLFILKMHPTLDSPHAAGFEKCQNLPNVLLVKDVPIIDCLASSDLWLTVESNTSVEAWLLDIPTAIINPSGTDWPVPRNDFHLYQPNYRTIEDLSQALSCFDEKGYFPEFDDFKPARETFIKSLIEHNDGLNHVRAGNFILDFLNQPERVHSQTKLKDHAKLLVNNILHWYLSPLHRFMPSHIPYFAQFKKFWETHRKIWNEEERMKTSCRLLAAQHALYEEKGLSLKDLRKIQAAPIPNDWSK